MKTTKITRPDGTVLVPVTIYLPEDEARALNTLALSAAVGPTHTNSTPDIGVDEVPTVPTNMISAYDAAKKLGMSHAHICHMLVRKEVAGKKVNGRWYVSLPITLTNRARIGGKWKPVTLTLTEVS